MITETKTIYDLQEIKAKLEHRIDEFVLTLFPAAKKQTGCYRVGNIDGNPGDSLSISTKSYNIGQFYDHANPAIKGSAWKLVHLVKGISIPASIAWLGNFLNIAPIQNFSGANKSTNYKELAEAIKPLSEDCIKYAAERKISKRTLDAYSVGTGARGELIFPHYDCESRLSLNKHWMPNNDKTMWCSPNPVHNLFGKDVCDPSTNSDRLIIVEGQWDALAMFELGLPAVSIPSGVSNMNWIKEDYEYLSYFDTIVLIMDNDAAGKKCAVDVAARLGIDKCIIVNLPLKDANDMLKAGRGGEIINLIESTAKGQLDEIVDAIEMKGEVMDFIRGDYLLDGDPFFIPGFDLTFRKNEITLWFGYTSQGKSQAVQNQVANLAARGVMSVVASFEQPPERTFGSILMNMTGNSDIVADDDFEKAFKYLSEHCFIYKSREKANPLKLINMFIHAHKRYGVTNFVIDNVMTMDVDRGDNTAQAQAIDAIRVFASNYPVHVHVVAHPRKSGEGVSSPPAIAEIQGASEWGNMPDNIITVWRDVSKHERLAEMKANDYPDDAMQEFWESTPCGKLICRKQRATGEIPMTNTWFDKSTKRFLPSPGPVRPMYSPTQKPWL
jgi:twinkle protein